jgi:hypothetical protein
MTRGAAVQRLVVLWLVLPVPSIIIVAAQTLAGKYGETSDEAWSWIVAQFAAILALVLAAAFSSPSKSWREKPASVFRWRCAAASSVFYAVLVLALLLIEPLLLLSPYEVLADSGWLLALVQGVVIACVGAVIFDGR